MPAGDFFSFCTSLKPIELRALGELSHVVRLGAGEVVYSIGDESDALFIINRGSIEMTQEDSLHETGEPLVRGAIFGEIGALTNLRRNRVVRTREAVSLQCFPRKNFAQIVLRVPSFFLYLSEQLAQRLREARDRAVAQSHGLELNGSFANFDLVTIYQTIVNSSQTGELCILNERNEPISAFYFEKGHPRCGQYEHLTGEEAFWQLFLREQLPGTFSFSSAERPMNEWMKKGQITRVPTDMLITALQLRDEFDHLLQEIPSQSVLVHRAKLNLDWTEKEPAELRPIAERIWQTAYSQPTTLTQLFRDGDVCEARLYKTVHELVRSKHFTLSIPEEQSATP